LNPHDVIPDMPVAPAVVGSFVDMLSSIDLKMACMRPTYLATSAWHEHIPFAFWLIRQQQPRVLVELGVHFGVSYFAFCQAIEKLLLPTRCYAVDTWAGDDHAGFYGPEVYRVVKGHNDELYSAFSCLINSTFDEACAHFQNGTIDLLHIDGFHTHSAVQHDFETWRPMLSDRAVVLFHDTNVRERDFGVNVFVDTLRDDYPVFDFVHGHGLSLVGVGTALKPGVQALFDAANKENARRDVVEFFARLGRACADAFTVRRLRAHLAGGNGTPSFPAVPGSTLTIIPKPASA
jgi:cephalosporin hydroxylase